MAKEKQTKSRIIHKHDIEANWNKAVNFIPDKGETIVYDIDDNYSYERIKMGDGETTVIALPFITDNIPQPDWNAREGEAGHVKNRTHYECDYSFDASLDIPTGTKKALTIEGLDISNKGAYWVVSINGDTTSRTAVYSGTVYIKIAGIEFSVRFAKDRKTGLYGMSVALSDVAPRDLHIEASYRYPGNVVTLDEKYIPDSVKMTDWSLNDPTKTGYVKNRTHYEAEEIVNEPLNITWDGNTEGLVSADGFPFYKVSDLVLTDEQIKLCTINSIGQVQDDMPIVVGEMWDDLLAEGIISINEEAASVTFVVFAKRDNANIEIEGMSATFPEAGIYFVCVQPDGGYVTALTTTEPVPQTKTVVKKLDKKYLPDDIGVGADWSQNDETAPDYVKNRTHYEHIVVFSESQNSKELTPVGYRADDRKAYFHDNFFIEVYFPDGRRYISDPDFANNKLFINEETGDIISSRLTADRTNGAWKLALFTDDIPSYMAYKYIIIKPLDIKYIPDEIARIATMETITPEMIIEIMDEVGAAQPIADADNAVLTTDDDKILIL